MMQRWFEEHPEKKESYFKEHNARLELLSNNFSGYKKAAPVYTIPVVFHILHMGGSENISDAQVMDAVQILTRDFRKKNPDTSQIQTVFKNIAADVEIEFVLATLDPNGNCTNGIIRHYDPNTNWTGNPQHYIYTWPPNKYLNIYVVKSMNFNAAGYTFFPGSVGPSMDAVVVLSNYVGSIGTSNPFLSRVITHEVGHWLDLAHVWGFNNSPGQTCGDDGIPDTPITMGWTSCNLFNNDVCNPGIKENVENYMEYSYCDKMFTLNQSQHMRNTLQSSVAGRNNLSSASNLMQTGVINPSGLCRPSVEIVPFPNATVCVGNTLTIKSFTWNGSPTSYNWLCTAPGSVLVNGSSQAVVHLPSAGNYTIQCIASNASGSSSSSTIVSAINLTPVIGAGQMESFENSLLPPGWSIPNNSNPSQNWKQTSAAASDGMNSMFIQGEAMPIGKISILQTPVYDFLNNPGAGFSFKYAYARKTSSTADRLRVLASKDCGGSWKVIWAPSIASLSNGSGGINNNIFVPSPSQWKNYSLDLHPNFMEFLTEPQVILRFEFTEDTVTGFQNRFYLDEINFTTPAGLIKNNFITEWKLFPNPAAENIHIVIQTKTDEEVLLQISDITGRTLSFEKLFLQSARPFEKEISLGNLNPGVYFIELKGKQSHALQRFIRD